MKLCRDCDHWYRTPEMQSWKGNCREHPFEKDRYSQDARPNEECKKAEGFVDKYAKYQTAAKEVKND